MSKLEPALIDLLGSRICHDLISPVGAIGNGVELLGMANIPDSPEVDLIRESVQSANARIRYFRIAFGLAMPDQKIARTEIDSIIDSYFAPTRLDVQFASQIEFQRAEVKLAFLILLCAESTLALGGKIGVHRTEDGWHIHGEAEKLRYDSTLWDWFSGGAPELAAGQVHFALAATYAKQMNRTVRHTHDSTRLSVSF